ncbi:UvrD-helicase domain-containing protein [Bacillus kwashiorkori]|uniref:UvrD-helicase domain-containing protein n=1 Tax=Bacillus kwashiorkori TaxID=1522318 RepID=UPI0007851EFF|nr:ATP-dependent helicase [Bacillus kwashiorkori]
MLEGLNSHQIDAVLSKRNTLVIACPGSGKTRVLTRKIAYELENLESKKKYVVALTFTNRAAEEIQKRLDEMGISQEQLWAGTIHSFCYQWIIQPYSVYEPNLVHGFSIIDENKKNMILNQLKEKNSLPYNVNINTSFDRKGHYLNEDRYKNEIASEFHQSILQNKEIDFDLILYYSNRLLENYPKIRFHLANLFGYIFVDEYQDTQDLQYAIIGQIIKESCNDCKLFLVGDPDQAIYESLGGIAKTPYEIQGDTGNEEIVVKELPGNYRSSQRVIDFFRNFQSTDVNIKALGANSEKAGIITLDTVTDKNNLPNEFAKIITQNIESGVKPNEICIIAPQWYFLTPLAKKLKSLLPNVPFDAPGLTPLPRNKENLWWRLSRLFLTEITPETSLNRFRWIRQIIEQINTYTNGTLGFEHKDCRKYLRLINSIKPRETEGVRYLEIAFKSFFEALEIDLNIHPVLNDQLYAFFKSINKRYESKEFDGIPSDVNYFKSVFSADKGIVINTCHGVKGEEFETVIAFGLLWGYVPHWSSIINKPKYEAQSASKKMLYVIGSRAKTNLHLFAEQGRTTINGFPYRINENLAEVSFKYDNEFLTK